MGGIATGCTEEVAVVAIEILGEVADDPLLLMHLLILLQRLEDQLHTRLVHVHLLRCQVLGARGALVGTRRRFKYVHSRIGT